MLSKLFVNTAYIRVYKNKFRIRHIQSKTEIVALPDTEFTTQRLLLAQFSIAEKTLLKGIGDLYRRTWFSPSPKVLIQQMEMNDGGLSESEQRILKEIAISTGARSVVVWDGDELTDSEVLKQVNNRKT
ncbi:MAG: 1-pyrroline-5-carboxylate dehydrogenase [Gammaproteobacteria bacterium]|nr:1-pyrroline-5-carboxylate dehydrogenase [Gammaproteobacteria bacterium]